MSRHNYKLYLGWLLASACGTSWSGVSAQNVTSADFPDCTGYGAFIQDGHCDEINNVADCGWDGGDCCLCTCLDDLEYQCGLYADFDCVDPDADCAASLGYPDCTGYLSNLEDGNCDEDLNNEECGYDGGDCCRCTCTGEYSWDCARGTFDCKDPEASDDCETASPTPSPAASYGYPDCTGLMYYHQNGYCQDDLNNEECGYDGGDCCRCTCRIFSTYDSDCWGSFDCKDPEAPLDCPTPSPAAAFGYPDCKGYIYGLQDGNCDEDLNNEECGYDGGDCCRCTCTSYYGCDGDTFDCKDPEAPDDCETESPTPSPAASYGYPDCTGIMYYHQNGYCSDDLNNEECGYDGGDCCRCTCRTLSIYDSDCSGDFDCKDPEAPDDCATASPTPSPAASYGYPDCEGYLYDFQNGNCDDDLNNAECGFDGGDCCSCTCESSRYTCGYYNSYNCLDPDAECAYSTSAETTDDDTSLCSDSSRVGNGYCSYDLNTKACDYDGGDCCECTCSETSKLPCGINGYDCLDPNACNSTSSSRSASGADSSTDSSTSFWSSSNSRSASGAASSSDSSTPFLTKRLTTILIVVLVLFGAGICTICLQFANLCRARKPDALHTRSKFPPPPRPHEAEALSHNPRSVSAPPPAPGQGAPAWYRRLWPEISSRQSHTGASASTPQRVSARSAPPQPSALPVLPQPSAPQAPLSADSRPIAPIRSNGSRHQSAPRTAALGPAPDEMVGGQPGIHGASESNKNVVVTGYQESGIAGIGKALPRDEGATVGSQHSNGIYGGETKSDEAAEPTGEYVAARSEDGGNEWGGDEDSIVDAEPPPSSVPLVAESSGGCDIRKESTRKAEAGSGSEEAEEETRASKATRELGGSSVKRCKEAEAGSEETKGAQNDDTAGKLASLERGSGAPADLEEEIVQEGASSGDRNGESSDAETGETDHGGSCKRGLEGDSETTREHALDVKATDVIDECVREGADGAPSGMDSEGAVTGHEKANAEEASREETDGAELGSVDAGPELIESTSDEEMVDAGIAGPAATPRESIQ